MMTAFEADGSAAAAFFKAPIPIHDEPEMHHLRARVLATWPAGTFVENIHARADGSMLVSVHSASELHRWREGQGVDVFARLPAPPAAINAHPDGGVIVVGGSVGTGPQFVWHVDDRGSVREIARVSDALFFNGATRFFPRHLLVAEAILGRIYHIDLATGASSVWLAHHLLAKITTEVMLPGVNGIKIFGRHVYVTNTDRALFLRIGIDERGLPGPIEILAEQLRADDFAFDCDGNAYLTTHIHNSLLRLTPGGARVNVAGADDGMAGSTAVAFGVDPGSQNYAFVTSTGGVLAPIDGIVQPAKLIRVDVGSTGLPITDLPLEP
jgi:hypothetical protein